MRMRITLIALGLAFSMAGAAQAQKAYDSAKAAADALVAAAAKGDTKALMAVLGPDSKSLVDSGDAVSDKSDIAAFAAKAKEKMSVEPDPAHPEFMILVLGNDNWPSPIPIVKGKDGKWRFDTADGKREVLARRIGGNELDTIALMRGYVEAQHDYALVEHDGSGMHQYAQKAISSPGKQDGLCWKNADGSYGGPLGDEVAAAVAQGYSDKTKPYNGYHFRVLTAQGPNAPKGARNYIINGAMIGGFGLLAWPATYDVTGIQTFMVNQDGDIYQKDLGPDTAKLAAEIKAYDPDKTWVVTEDDETDDDGN